MKILIVEDEVLIREGDVYKRQQIGMPTTLKEMHLENASYEDLLKVGQQATIEGETIHQMPFEVKDVYKRHHIAQACKTKS